MPWRINMGNKGPGKLRLRWRVPRTRERPNSGVSFVSAISKAEHSNTVDRDGRSLGCQERIAVEKSRRIGAVRDRGGELSYLDERKDASGLDFLARKRQSL